MVTRRAFDFLLAGAAALLLAACSLQSLVFSNVTTAYNNATPVLAWMVDDYVDLSEVQKEFVRERLARTVAWHRARELPEYRRFFETVLARIEDNITVDEARDAHRDIRASYHRLVEHVLPDFADLLLQLDAEQLAQLERKFNEENRKIVREAARETPEEGDAKRVRRFVDNLEEWTGRLSGAQRDLVAARVKSIAVYTDERVAERRFRQAEILALARTKPAREQVIAGLKRLLVDTDTWRRPDYRRKLSERDHQIFEMIATLSTTLSADQRANVQKRVRGFMRDISELNAST